jgi:cell wall assembly regulator SMI1
MMEFSHLLQRLDELLQQHRPAYYATLNPPAAATELAVFEAEFGLTLPDELRQWWGWHDGQEAFDSFIQNKSLLSLNSAAETMRINGELLADGEFVLNWWRAAWVPFLENGGGDLVCLDLEGTFMEQPGQILQHWHDWEPRTILFPDLTAWLAGVVATYEQAYADGPISDDEFTDYDPAFPFGFPQEFEAGS